MLHPVPPPEEYTLVGVPGTLESQGMQATDCAPFRREVEHRRELQRGMAIVALLVVVGVVASTRSEASLSLARHSVISKAVSSGNNTASIKSGTSCKNWEDILMTSFSGVLLSDCQDACDGTPGCHSLIFQHEECGQDCHLFAKGCKESPDPCYDLIPHGNATKLLALNKKGTGCKNTEDILIGNIEPVHNKHQCAMRCREVDSCEQFNFLPSGGDDNCALFKAGCLTKASLNWDLYDSVKDKPTNDAAIPEIAAVSNLVVSCKPWEDIVMQTLSDSSPSQCRDACESTAGCRGHAFQREECGSDCHLIAEDCQESPDPCFDLTPRKNASKLFGVHKAGTGCKNSDFLLLGNIEAVSNQYQCAMRCQELALCEQFNYLASGGDNCALFKAGCLTIASEWDLYGDVSKQLDTSTLCNDKNWEAITMQSFSGLSRLECQEACERTPGCHSHAFQHEDCGSGCHLLAERCTKSSDPCFDVIPSANVTKLFALNATGRSCKNAEDIRIGSVHAVSNKYQCAMRCRAMVSCKQFAYIASHIANCALLRAGCLTAASEMWDLYDDMSEKALTNDAAVLGFDSQWHLERKHDNWIFDGTTSGPGCDRAGFHCPAKGVQDLVAAGPPARRHWQAVFEDVMTREGGSGDRCDENLGPRLFATARLSESGLTSRLNNFANEILWAMWAGMPISLCTGGGVRDSWQQYFKPLGNSSECSQCGGVSQFAAGVCSGAYASRFLNEHTLVDLKRFIYSKIFKFNAKVLKKRAALIKGLALGGVPLIGVHIRRGDKKWETGNDYIGVETFGLAVRQQCYAMGVQLCKVYVASDWPDARKELHAQVPEMGVVAQDQLPSELYDVRNKHDEDEQWRERAEESFILDLSMLIHSDAFIGTSSSNVARFVFFMRATSNRSLSLDDNASFISRNC